MDSLLLTLLAFACPAASLAMISTPLAIRAAQHFRLTDDPQKDALKIHAHPTPFLGGAVVLASMLTVVGATTVISPFIERAHFAMLAFAMGASWVFGLWDDINWSHRSWKNLFQKIFSQIFLVALASYSFSKIEISFLLLSSPLLSGILNALIFLVILNATNMYDGMDGLLAGVSLISSLGFLVLFFFGHSFSLLGVIVAASLSGTLFAYLLYNRHPALLFLGDNGSYVLGFLMMLLMAFAVTETPTPRAITAASLLYGLPLLNNCFVFANRILKGVSPLLGDRSHIYDIVYKKTKSYRGTILINYLLQATLVLGGLWIALTV